tara:strand:- start:232 stop:669 length:438 start_codon:yes stop_codon:yes gene_type:complete
MAFKMKGPTFFRSALKNVGKGYYKKQNPSAAFQHYVDDNAEHQETYGDHSDDLQTEEEHKADKNKGKKKDDLALDRMEATGGESPMAHRVTSDKTKLTVDHEHTNDKGEVIETHTYRKPQYEEGTKIIRPNTVDSTGTITKTKNK